MRPPYGPITRPLIFTVGTVQSRAARWATRDYRYTSSVTAMMKDLNWYPLGQRRVNRRLVMMYKCTYDLGAIPVSEYHICNTRSSAHNHPLAY